MGSTIETMSTGVWRELFREVPNARRRLVLLLYALVGPVFTLVLCFVAVDANRMGAVAGVVALIGAGAAWLGLRKVPTNRDWVFPVAIVPTVCCGIAFYASEANGPAYLAVTGAPLAWAAVLFEAPVVWAALATALGTCLAAVTARHGLITGTANTIVFGTIFSLVAWVVHRQAQSLRSARAAIEVQAQRDRAVLEAIPDALARADAHGRFIEAHAPPGEALPVPLDEVPGHLVYDFLPADVGARMRAAIARTLESGELTTVEYAADYPGGSRSFEARIARSLPGEIVVIRRDVTERQRAVEEQRFHAALLGAMQEAVVATDLNLVVRYWSPGAERLFGWTAAEALDRPVVSLVRPGLDAQAILAFREKLLGGGIRRETSPRTRKDGATPIVETSFVVLTAADGTPVGTMGVSRDVTEVHVAEERLREALRTNEQMVVELQDALSSVRTLTGLLPMCMHCHKIRDDSGYWSRIEAYISARTDASFSHALCPECYEKHFSSG